LTSRFTGFRDLGALAPRFRMGLRLTSPRRNVRLFILPFQRSPLFISVAGIALVVFCIPFLMVGGFLDGGDDDSLSGLVFTLFSLFWLLGWSVGVLLLLAAFLLLAFGVETVQLRPGGLTLRVEVLRLGLGADFRAAGIENLRWEPVTDRAAAAASGFGWRGDHLAFDYGGKVIRLGSRLDQNQAQAIIRHISEEAIDTAAAVPTTATGSGMAAGFSAARGVPGTPVPGLLNGLSGSATSVWILVLANLIPLAGVLLGNWEIGDIMLVFWAESAIIGFFNLLKMWVIGRWSMLLLGPFFVGHFGAFMVGHLLFIYALFLADASTADPDIGQVLADFVFLWPALLGLFISHGISFQLNFLGRREYRGITVQQQMGAPYKRIVIMHVTIIFGGFLTQVLDTPVLALVLLIVLKIIVDARAHRHEHQREPGQKSG